MKPKSIHISKSCLKKLKRWSLSKNETGGYCYGTNGIITEVIRLRNVERISTNAYSYNRRQFLFARDELKKPKLKLISGFHSHPSKRDRAIPSQGDCEGISEGTLEIIIAPAIWEIRLWKISRSRKRTIEQEVILEVLKT